MKSKLRALIVTGALLSLCASDNVGPRLLPLPVAEAAAAPQPEQGGAARVPAPAKSAGGRVELISTSQSRAGAARQQSQAAAHTPKFVPTPPRAERRPCGGPCALIGESRADFSRPKGRAPPQLA